MERVAHCGGGEGEKEGGVVGEKEGVEGEKAAIWHKAEEVFMRTLRSVKLLRCSLVRVRVIGKH